MKVCLAQVGSIGGDVQRNVDHHVDVLRALVPMKVDLVVFPELSLSNYEPGLAEAAAISPDDARLAAIQRFVDETGTTVAVGAPLRASSRPIIALLVVRPGNLPVVIGKSHLHADEVPYFSPWAGGVGTIDVPPRVGVAICYEVSVPEHAAAVMARGAALYVASVAKTAEGVAEAQAALSRTARTYGVPVLMVNSVGTCEGKAAGGRSMAIDASGRRLAALDESNEGFLVFDRDAGTASPIQLNTGR